MGNDGAVENGVLTLRDVTAVGELVSAIDKEGPSTPIDSAEDSKENTKEASVLSPTVMNKLVRYSKVF